MCGKRVGDDRRRVGHQARAAYALHDPQNDQIISAGGTGKPIDRE
jgi:hypothetical protein